MSEAIEDTDTRDGAPADGAPSPGGTVTGSPGEPDATLVTSQAPAASSPGPRLLGGRYRLDARIASGGMAAVWRGHDLVLARTVAVKLLHDHLAADAEFRERFRREAISAAKLAHPHVVGLYDTGSHGDQVFLVMEYVEGATLRDVIAATRGLTPRDAAAICEQVAQALHYAHRRGLVHRDVKPANILLGSDGSVKVADFGIAKADQADDLTKTGMVLGTAAYVAPEQVLGRAIDGRVDQYALGCVLYEALTGQQPYRSSTAVATAAMRLERVAAPPRSLRADLPAGLEDIVLLAMAREPEGRYTSAGALAQALSSFVGPSPADTAERVAGLVARAIEPPRPVVSQGAEVVPPAEAAPAAVSSTRGVANGAPPVSRRRRGRSLAALAVAVAVAVGGGLAARRPQVPAPQAAPSSMATQLPVERSGTVFDDLDLQAGDLSSFDPEGNDGGDENSQDLPRLIDGDADSAWESSGYRTPSFGNLKRGVGFVVDLGAPTLVEAVELSLPSPGINVELRVADTRPRQASDATRRAGQRGAAARALLAPDEPVETRYLLVWITGNLQPRGDYEFNHYAAVSELVVRGVR